MGKKLLLLLLLLQCLLLQRPRCCQVAAGASCWQACPNTACNRLLRCSWRGVGTRRASLDLRPQLLLLLLLLQLLCIQCLSLRQ